MGSPFFVAIVTATVMGGIGAVTQKYQTDKQNTVANNYEAANSNNFFNTEIVNQTQNKKWAAIEAANQEAAIKANNAISNKYAWMNWAAQKTKYTQDFNAKAAYLYAQSDADIANLKEKAKLSITYNTKMAEIDSKYTTEMAQNSINSVYTSAAIDAKRTLYNSAIQLETVDTEVWQLREMASRVKEELSVASTEELGKLVLNTMSGITAGTTQGRRIQNTTIKQDMSTMKVTREAESTIQNAYNKQMAIGKQTGATLEATFNEAVNTFTKIKADTDSTLSKITNSLAVNNKRINDETLLQASYMQESMDRDYNYSSTQLTNDLAFNEGMVGMKVNQDGEVAQAQITEINNGLDVTNEKADYTISQANLKLFTGSGHGVTTDVNVWKQVIDDIGAGRLSVDQVQKSGMYTNDFADVMKQYYNDAVKSTDPTVKSTFNSLASTLGWTVNGEAVDVTNTGTEETGTVEDEFSMGSLRPGYNPW